MLEKNQERRMTEGPTPAGAIAADGWFRGAGLGLFVHWDHASCQGLEIGWPIVGEWAGGGRITPAEYFSSAPDFDPQNWDAEALVAQAKRAGATYVVFTTRHHGGYSMFHTKHSGFSIEHSVFGRDITRELVDALHAAGLRVGFYYSLSDWHHPDYPAFTDDQLPYPQEKWPNAGLAENAGLPIATDRHRRPEPQQWDRYLGYLRGQLTELLTNYGRVDLVWFDGEWERSPEEWRTTELRSLIRQLAPEVVVNDRLLGHGDYQTPEQGFPATASEGPWELCLTMAEMWAWVPTDTNYKTSRHLIRTLIEVVSRGGNLLLNVGPKGDGSLVPAQVERLDDLAVWMTTHRSSVIGVRPAPEVDFYGPVTRTDSTIYLHLVMTPVEEVVVRGLPAGRVRRISLLGADRPIAYESRFEIHQDNGPDAIGELRFAAPVATGALIDVIAIELG
jgi:alpha-L-fucosidase